MGNLRPYNYFSNFGNILKLQGQVKKYCNGGAISRLVLERNFFKSTVWTRAVSSCSKSAQSTSQKRQIFFEAWFSLSHCFCWYPSNIQSMPYLLIFYSDLCNMCERQQQFQLQLLAWTAQLYLWLVDFSPKMLLNHSSWKVPLTKICSFPRPPIWFSPNLTKWSQIDCPIVSADLKIFTFASGFSTNLVTTFFGAILVRLYESRHISRATWRLQRGVVSLVGDEYLFHTAQGTSFFIFPRIIVIIELTLRKLKKSHVQSSRIFISEKGLLGQASGTAHPKILRLRFWIPNTKFDFKIPGFVAVIIGFREIPRQSSDESPSHLKNNVFWVHMRFFWHKIE